MNLGFLRSPLVIVVLIIYVIADSGPRVVHAVDDIFTGNIVFNGPGQNGARDIHTTGNLGGLRIYNGNSLTASPGGAAIQFFGNGHTGFPGQAFIDSGANDNAAVIFRTAGTGQGITERMRVTATGNVGIGTASPQEQLQLTGNLRLPATTSTTGIIRSGSDTLLHTFGSNFFAGIGAGNLTMTGLGLNTAIGNNALQSNTTGFFNTATGQEALQFNTEGPFNTATGQSALRNNTTGNSNTATGQGALVGNTTGNNNTATGIFALGGNTTGSSNVAVGSSTGTNNSTGSNNTFIGYQANPSTTALSNATAIGSNATVGASNSLVLGNGANVGVGTSVPQSKLEVAGGYLQFSATSDGPPTAADCDADAERGRLVIDTTNNLLYVCNGAARGWDFIALTN